MPDSADTPAILAALASELASKCERVGDCVLWRGGCSPQGYGRVNIPKRLGGKYMSAHRASWVVNRGPIPDGLFVLHRCRNKNCFNPEHLYVGTQRENVGDALRDGTFRGGGKYPKSRTHCNYGHEFTPENTRVRGCGSRECVACAKARKLAGYRRGVIERGGTLKWTWKKLSA